jgi:tripartite-type tricarboxylate transporter receptor subunit TctC
MNKSVRNALLSLVCAVLGAMPHPADAQTYPSKPIRMIVAYGAGSGADIIARIVAEKLSEQMKNNVFVENRDGAGGLIGTIAAARSAPDGYTLLLAPTTLTVAHALQAEPPYDPVKDFVGITRVSILPVVIVASPNAPYTTFKELVAYIKANPGKLNYATSGKGSPSHLEIELIKQTYGLDVPDVPYKNFGQAITDTIAGRVGFYPPVLPAALPHIKSGKVRALAIGTPRRSEQVPEVPTLAEQLGAPGYQSSVWYGVVAPAGLPADIVARLHEEIAKALENPQVRARITGTGAEVSMAPPAEFGAQIRAETEKWTKLVRALKLRAEQ